MGVLERAAAFHPVGEVEVQELGVSCARVAVHARTRRRQPVLPASGTAAWAFAPTPVLF